MVDFTEIKLIYVVTVEKIGNYNSIEDQEVVELNSVVDFVFEGKEIDEPYEDLVYEDDEPYDIDVKMVNFKDNFRIVKHLVIYLIMVNTYDHSKIINLIV